VDLQKYFEVMELKPTIKDSPNAVAIKEVKGNIEFDDVSFAYHKGQKVLKDINLHIRPDETIALVGQSGSGKTTITKLLMRFYDVSQGEIKLDDQDLRDLKIYDLRRAIGLVPQEAVLFNDTIAYNIAYGKSDATQEEIEEATKKANLHEFVMKLPRKYGTIVGERGVKLSGGQKQRLAIARVILENPEIIIFDEATSQLDSSNERKIQQAFQNLTKNKTTIIIAHRLSTVMDADRIIVFKQGQIVQQGKHQELIKQDGVYKHLWQLQTQKNQVAKNTQVLDN
jgi:ATP-binding cassette subfamily B protein